MTASSSGESGANSTPWGEGGVRGAVGLGRRRRSRLRSACRRLLRTRNAPWQAVGRLWPVETVSFASTLRLERKLCKLGMRRSAIKGVLRLVREADRHRLEPRLFIGEWKLRRYRPAPAARALWAAAAGRPCRLWRYLFDDAVGQQQQ